MVRMYAVIEDYKDKKIGLEEANEVLKECGIQLDAKGKVICPDISKVTGFALLDCGVGEPSPSMVQDGELVDDMGSMYVNVIIGNLVFEVKDKKLVYYMEKK